jgi:hypothetical protein
MRKREDARMWPAAALIAVAAAAGCGGQPVPDSEAVESEPVEMVAAAVCQDSGSTSTVPCAGLSSGTSVSFKVLPSSDSGSTSTVPYARLAADCTESGSGADSGSTSTVPCAIYVRKQ